MRRGLITLVMQFEEVKEEGWKEEGCEDYMTFWVKESGSGSIGNAM